MDKDVGVLRTHIEPSDVTENAGTKLGTGAALFANLSLLKRCRARRLDTKCSNRWEAQFDKRPVGRSASHDGAIKIALQYALAQPGDTVSADGTSSLRESSLNKSNPSASGGAE